MASEKRLKASLISPSSCAETLCSLASFERGAALVWLEAEAAGPDLRFGGYGDGGGVSAGGEAMIESWGYPTYHEALLGPVSAMRLRRNQRLLAVVPG